MKLDCQQNNKRTMGKVVASPYFSEQITYDFVFYLLEKRQKAFL